MNELLGLATGDHGQPNDLCQVAVYIFPCAAVLAELLGAKELNTLTLISICLFKLVHCLLFDMYFC